MQKFEMDGSGWHTIPGTNRRSPCQFLNKKTLAFYHGDYNSNGDWQRIGTVANLIWTLKNDVHPFPQNLPSTIQKLKIILRQDLPEVLKQIGSKQLTICVVPRAKNEQSYRQDQLNFKRAVYDVANELSDFIDGTSFIIRRNNTQTTHLERGQGEGGDGNLPYPGITKDTCIISDEVKEKDILLIDDVYTKDVGIDEDAIQALLDHGASSVIFYSIGKTLK
jgi:hypothetical protein